MDFLVPAVQLPVHVVYFPPPGPFPQTRQLVPPRRGRLGKDGKAIPLPHLTSYPGNSLKYRFPHPHPHVQKTKGPVSNKQRVVGFRISELSPILPPDPTSASLCSASFSSLHLDGNCRTVRCGEEHGSGVPWLQRAPLLVLVSL